MVAQDLRDFLLGTSALQPGEVPLFHTRPSNRLLWAETLQILGVVAITLLITGATERAETEAGVEGPGFQGPLVGASAVFFEIVFLGPRVLRAWIHVAFTEYVLTSQRIYTRTEFVSTDLRVIPYERVTLVRVGRGLWERIFGISHISLRAYGDVEEQVRLRGLVDPWPLYQQTRSALRTHNTVDAIVRSD